MLKDKIDIRGGKLTYGQRIELGRIMEEHAARARDGKARDVQLIKDIYRCLYDRELRIAPQNAREAIAYTEEVIGDILYWIEREKLLKYDPTPEEASAGIRQLSASIGDFGTIKALAKTYAQDPDNILRWEYGKVFGLLYTDLEEHRFQQRLQKAYEKKRKQ